jgi:hypothetical protein
MLQIHNIYYLDLNIVIVILLNWCYVNMARKLITNPNKIMRVRLITRDLMDITLWQKV